MYQDKLEKNGRELISHGTEHIQVHYFFIKGHILVGDKTLEHFPMGNMLGYQFTKPRQGSIFRKFRSEIQGIPYDTEELDI